jgi:SAM-dependent methyltransferase
MTEPTYVHGRTDAREVARLEKQADFTAALTFSRLELAPGHRVLDLATGVGAMGVRLQRASPGAHVVGVDLSADQLAASRRNHPALPVARGDATRLPFADGTFDRVHCSWLLEHVPAPVAVLREVRRVLKPGGFCLFVEVDNATFAVTPASHDVDEVLRRLNDAQRRGGGDPFVGQHLEAHLAAAGFTDRELDRTRLVGDARDPAFFQAFVDEFAEIFEGLDESLGQGALPLIERAIRHLRALPTSPDASLRYTPVIARAWKGE